MVYVVINGLIGGLIGFLLWEIRNQQRKIKKLREIRHYIDENGNEFSIKIAEIERIFTEIERNNKRDE